MLPIVQLGQSRVTRCSDAKNINLSNYIAGKHAPVQKWLWLGEAQEPCERVQLSLPMYSFADELTEVAA